MSKKRTIDLDAWRAWKKRRHHLRGKAPHNKGVRQDPIKRQWSWGHTNSFQPSTKWTQEGKLTIPQPRTTLMGCIYYSIKELRFANDYKIVRHAIDHGGLASLTRQSPFRVTQVMLRRLAQLGVIRRRKHVKNKGHAERYARNRH